MMIGTRFAYAAGAAFLLTPTIIATSPAAYAAGTVTGTWSGDCKNISINSSGYDPTWKVYVRWYNNVSTTAPGIDGETYAPINQAWSMSVDPSKVRGFSYRIVDSTGVYKTPLLDEAVACNVVLSSSVTATKKTCNTITATGINLGTYYRTMIRFRKSDGTYMDGGNFLNPPADKVIENPKVNGTYVSTQTGTISLPTGSTYVADAGIIYNDKWYSRAVSEPVDLTAPCPASVVYENTKPISVQVDWKGGSGYNSDDLVLQPGQASLTRNGVTLSFDPKTGKYTVALAKDMGWEIKVIEPVQNILCGSNYGKECAQSYTFDVPGTTAVKTVAPVAPVAAFTVGTFDLGVKTASISTSGFSALKDTSSVGGKALVTSSASAAIAVPRVKGNGIVQVYGVKHKNGSKMAMFVDGRKVKTFDTYSAKKVGKTLLGSVAVAKKDSKKHSVVVKSVKTSTTKNKLIVDTIKVK